MMDILSTVNNWQTLEMTCPNLIYGIPPRVKINVSGHFYEIYTAILDAYPSTLLGNHQTREKYRRKSDYYVFHRHPSLFSYILYYHIQGFVQRPANLPWDLFVEECRFFSIPIQLEEDRALILRYEQISVDRQSIPRSFSIFSLIINVFSCSNLIFQVSSPRKSFFYDENSISTSTTFWIDLFCSFYFLIEFYLRSFIWGKFDEIHRHWTLFVDFISISPVFFSLLTESLIDWFPNLIGLSPFYLCLKSFRILRLVRSIPSLDFIRESLCISLNVVFVNFILSSVLIFPFGILIYLFERHHSSSIIVDLNSGLHWAVETIYTIGFGEFLPRTYQGRCFAIVVCVCGFIILALPIPIVFRTYQIVYENDLKKRLWRMYR